MKLVAGIDPGKSGGWAVFDCDTGQLIEAGRINHDDMPALARALTGCEEILIERAQSSNQMGVSSSFEYGRNFGRIESVAILTGADIYYCASSWWKGKLAVSPDKELAIAKAIRTIPGLKNYVKYKADDGVAEAALIGTVLLSNKLFQQLEANNIKRAKPKKKKVSYRL